MPPGPKKGSSNWALNEEEREEEKDRASQRIGIDDGWKELKKKAIKKRDKEEKKGKNRSEITMRVDVSKLVWWDCLWAYV